MADQANESDLAPFRAGAEVPPPAAATPPEGQANPLEMVMDRMHGRWLWAALLAILLAPIGALVGYFLTPVKYVARGQIMVQREVEMTTTRINENQPTIDLAGVVGDQAVHARSDRVLEMAIRDPRLVPYRDRIERYQTEAITDGLEAAPVRGTGIVSVEMESDNPGFSAAAVNSLLDAYMAIYGPNSEEKHRALVDANREGLTKIRNDIESRNRERLQLIQATADGTPNLTKAIDDRVADGQRMSLELAAIQASMDRIKSRLGLAGTPPDDAQMEPTEVELEQANPALAMVRRQRDQAASEAELASRNYSEKHPIRQQVKRNLELAEKALDHERTSARANWLASVGQTLRYGDLVERARVLTARIGDNRQIVTSLLKTQADVAAIDRELAQLSQEEGMYVDRLKGLESEAATLKKGRVEIGPAIQPTVPAKDKRKQMAVAGALGGCALSLGFFFLLGTLDRRTFGTRQLAGSSGKLLLAGAIPDMDEMAEDEGGTEFASNCIHRIRTRLESRRTPGDGYAIMVSSPFQGDGKTTVAVALAWSYAESGSKTLLVDCDFIGQALSFQFGKLAEPGVREVLQGVPSEKVVTPLGTPLLSILPVGADRTFGASRAHPAALRRLFRDLREHYEIIIVDTGPMTASIEALPVASAVDGVLLSLKRGRSRARLEECIQDIASVGAEYLGVVLNCADRKDCIRYGSVSRLSAELSRALEGTGGPPPKHPLLTAIKMDADGSDQSAGAA